MVLVASLALLAPAARGEGRPSKVDRGAVAVPSPSPKALAFYRSGVPLWFLGRAWGIAVPALILFSGLSARIRRVASGKGRPWAVTIAAYAALFLAVRFLLEFPLRFYAGFVRLHEYGLSNQSFGRWLGEMLKGLGVEVVLASLLLWVPYGVMARSPRRWWLYVGLLTLPFAVVGAVITPVAIEPLFNRFGPMEDKALEARIDALARRAGIDGGRIFEVDKSADTRTVNAYVTGLFGTKRIVLWDTLLAKLDGDEVLAVMGHEMGHYALDHVAQGVVLSSLGSVFALYLIYRGTGYLIRRFGDRFGFRQVSDVASVPLILMLAEVTILLGSPLENAVSRHMEHEADRFALEITRDNHAAATAFVKLQDDNLSIPRPPLWSVILRSTHPSIGDRIDFCNAYRPWASGEPLKYGAMIREP